MGLEQTYYVNARYKFRYHKQLLEGVLMYMYYETKGLKASTKTLRAVLRVNEKDHVNVKAKKLKPVTAEALLEAKLCDEVEVVTIDFIESGNSVSKLNVTR